MTAGALIFAFNNEQTDYVAMAAWSAQNIQRHLNIPVAVVTNDTQAIGNSNFSHVIVADAESGGTRYFEDYAQTVTWHNAGRVDAYALSPFDQTLVLDADYVVASDQLKVLLHSSQEFLAHSTAFDITGIDNFAALNCYGEFKMPMSWATVMMFRRSDHAELIFECMKMVRHNWRHYKDLYKIASSTYRNDYALSIALNIVHGQTLEHPAVPWNLASVTPEHRLTQVTQDHYRVDYIDQDKKPRWITLQNQDFHAMGKQHLENIIETH